MNLLTVEEVTQLWRCHRVTVLRLMRRGTLRYVEVDGEPRFDEAEVRKLNHPGIARYPHLTIAVGPEPNSSSPSQKVEEDYDYYHERCRRAVVESAEVVRRAKWLMVESQLAIANASRAVARLTV
jgi:excisionase family DNA binding protein